MKLELVISAGDKAVEARLRMHLRASSRLSIGAMLGPEYRQVDCAYFGTIAGIELGLLRTIPEPGYLGLHPAGSLRLATGAQWAVVGRVESDELYNDAARIGSQIVRIERFIGMEAPSQGAHVRSLSIYLDFLTDINEDNVDAVARALSAIA